MVPTDAEVEDRHRILQGPRLCIYYFYRTGFRVAKEITATEIAGGNPSASDDPEWMLGSTGDCLLASLQVYQRASGSNVLALHDRSRAPAGDGVTRRELLNRYRASRRINGRSTCKAPVTLGASRRWRPGGRWWLGEVSGTVYRVLRMHDTVVKEGVVVPPRG